MIPGLIDSHLHAIRAALTFSTEVNWIGARSLREALARISDAAANARPPGSWLIVAGGWNELQFAEKRRPTQAELEAAAPRNPVYVQLGYGWVVMTDDGFAKLGIDSDADLPAGGTLERDAAGALDRRHQRRDKARIIALFDRLPKPTFARAGRKARREFFRELNRLGLTGVVDPGGNNLFPADYQALFDVWRARRADRARRVQLERPDRRRRVRPSCKSLTALLPMGFGDDTLHFNGIGERITFAMNNNPEPTRRAQGALLRDRALGGRARHDDHDALGPRRARSHHLLDDLRAREPRGADRAAALVDRALERRVGRDACERMSALGVGWTVQDAMYFGGDELVRRQGADAGAPHPARRHRRAARRRDRRAAPTRTAWRRTTRSPRCSGSSTARPSAARRSAAPRKRRTALDALQFYTLGSAWFSHDDDVRGSLEVGKLADLAVLSQDYLTVPLDEIGNIESVLTLLGGEVVYAAGPFASLERKR